MANASRRAVLRRGDQGATLFRSYIFRREIYEVGRKVGFVKKTKGTYAIGIG
jgi:hypothetical protein